MKFYMIVPSCTFFSHQTLKPSLKRGNVFFLLRVHNEKKNPKKQKRSLQYLSSLCGGSTESPLTHILDLHLPTI